MIEIASFRIGAPDRAALAGNPIKPNKVTFASGGGEVRLEPDLAAADGVQTTLPPFSGLDPFFGTSAAAPHVAGIAGLIKGAIPGASSLQIRNALKSGTLDIDTVQLRVQLVNHGGAKATAVTASLTSPSPDVQITQPTATYPTVFPGATATNPTPFAFVVAPTTPWGARLPFRLTINYTGKGTHPTVLSFEFQTGRPAEVFTTTAYTGPAVAIPDGDLGGIDIPFAVAATGPIAALRFRIDGTTCSADADATTVGVDHTWVGDLAFRLTSPVGTTVTRFDAPGGPNNSGNNFCQTVLDDTASRSIQEITVVEAPYTGTFRPASLFSAFSGQDAAGTWNLHVEDGTPLDTGSVRAFSVETSGFTCAP
ncbi:MAG: proprotein convertase P-domain-containing protein [Myxococcota bacterium]|nr:proprotein convertase P-domain-containing protein [Myxococcota bacterium]